MRRWRSAISREARDRGRLPVSPCSFLIVGLPSDGSSPRRAGFTRRDQIHEFAFELKDCLGDDAGIGSLAMGHENLARHGVTFLRAPEIGSASRLRICGIIRQV